MSPGDAAIDLRPRVDAWEDTVHRHALPAPGSYRRTTLPRDGAEPPDAPDPYGCADAVNLLYTIGRLPADAAWRRAHRDALRALQDPASGLWREETHHPFHTTAHCAGALELLDARPAHPLKALSHLEAEGALEAFLDGLEWRSNPWIASHRGAGIFAARVLAGESTPEWEARYLDWLARETDPDTGLLRRGRVPSLERDGVWVFPHLAGTFHYLFNEQHAGRPHAHAERLADTCLALHARELFPFQRFVGFAEVDWAYCLHRAVRQTGHREGEARDALAAFARRHAAFVGGLDLARDPGADDLHALFGAVSALAELQAALPGLLVSDPPLRLVLDRRPFL